MMSRTFISSARRTGSRKGSSTAAIMIGTRSVRAAIADARSNGAGRYPSGDAWCSHSTTAAQPRVSAQAHISMAAA